MGLAVQREVDEVRDQEDRRKDKCERHRGAVMMDVALPYLIEAGDERDGRERIEHRIDQRKRMQLRAGDVGGSVEVDQPAYESAGDSRNGDDAEDDARWCA